MRNAYIKSVGAFAPSRVVPNSYFNEILREDVDTWLRENLTIRERRWCSENESTADLCVEAAKAALSRAALEAAEIDLIIIATDTPEFISPSTASVVQHRLGAKNAGTFDLNTACAGFVTAVDVASKFIIADENYTNVLVVGAYAMSKYLDLHDKKTVTLFADGAGAVVMSAENSSGSKGYVTSKLMTEGEYSGWMGIYGGGTKFPLTEANVREKEHLLKFVKKFPKELNPEKWSGIIREMTERKGLSTTQIAHFIFTQININSIRATLDILGEPWEKAPAIMDRYAYTGSACIPMALNDLYEKGKLEDDQLIVMMGSGGGLAYAGAIFRWKSK